MNKIEEFYEQLSEIEETNKQKGLKFYSSDNIPKKLKYKFMNEYGKDLYELSQNNFDRLNIKNCINFDDYKYKETISEYLKNGKHNQFIEDDRIDGYKVLLLGYSGHVIRYYITAIYVPNHVNIIYINDEYEIHTENKSSFELYQYDLENLLENSHKLPINEPFNEIYKKIILTKPFITNNNIIWFHTNDMFYYEAIITTDIKMKHISNKIQQLSVCYEKIESILFDKIKKEHNTCCFETPKHNNAVYIKIYDDSSDSDESNKYDGSNEYDRSFKMTYIYLRPEYGTERYISTTDDHELEWSNRHIQLSQVVNYNNKILAMFLMNRDNINGEELSHLPF